MAKLLPREAGAAARARRALAALGALMTLGLVAPPALAERTPHAGLPASLADRARDLLPDQRPPASLFEARRQAARAAETLARLLESEGYYAATVEPFADSLDEGGHGVRVTPGPLFTFAGARIEYVGTPPDATVADRLQAPLDEIALGAPARADPVLDVEDALVGALRRGGYPEARAEPVDALADGREATLEIAYRLVPGRRAAFGELRVEGLERTRPSLVERLRPWRDGDLYSPQRIEEFRSRLQELGVFDAVAVEFAPEQAAVGDAGAGAAARPVEVRVTEGPRRTIALGAYASTSEGAGVEAEWTLRNLSGRADSITLSAEAATLERRLGAAWRLPHVGDYGRNLTLAAAVEDFETDAFDQRGGRVGATLEDRLNARLLASAGVEASYALIDDARSRARSLSAREIYAISAPVTAEYVGVDDVLDPDDGFRARLAVEPGATWGDARIGFTRTSLETSAYRPFGEDLVGAARLRVGTILGPDGAPPDRLFFAGGGGSVRGYEFQSLSPRDAAGELLGGRSLIETSLEARWRRSDRLGFVAFVDAGAAGSDASPAVDEMRAGAGLGVRYYAGFGPLRADLAIPLDPRPGDADFQIYLSIGQAF
jgi:translocation and assembly module TamA